MTIAATQKFTRQTPRKLRLVANAVRKLSLQAALEQLAVIERKASIGVLKVVQQAIANATNNYGYRFEDLTLKNILVTEGSRLKRFRAVSRGRGHGVLKRTSHVRVELEAGVAKTADNAEKATKPVVEAEVVQTTTKSVKKDTKSPAKVAKKTVTKAAAPTKKTARENSKKV